MSISGLCRSFSALARLLLCSPTQDVQLLAQLRRLVTETTATTPAE
jgi:hypothetical protein